MFELNKIRAEIALSMIKGAQEGFWDLIEKLPPPKWFKKIKIEQGIVQMTNRELLFIYVFLLCKNDDEKAKSFIVRYFLDEIDLEKSGQDYVDLYMIKVKKYKIWYDNFINSSEIVNTFYWEVPSELAHILNQNKNVFLVQKIAEFLMRTSCYMDDEMDDAIINALGHRTDM